ncbi:MAG: SGNH/GDSL hydrolase family protein [Clostridia bacterium]|nr:SGNH/GDSL hydrolase family protein [Clostridia bacterium]
MKHYSVIGDSISTFEGTMPEGYALYYDKQTQEANGMRGVENMWWYSVGRMLGAELLVNGSWSGGTVVGEYPGACSEERVAALGKDGRSPDYILIYIGINDCGSCVKLYQDSPGEPDSACFASAYRLMLSRLKKSYPDAKIFCGTVMRTRNLGVDRSWDLIGVLGRGDLEAFNDEIRAAAAEYGCTLVDLFMTGWKYDALDGVHPTAAGHECISSSWVECMNRDGILRQNNGRRYKSWSGLNNQLHDFLCDSFKDRITYFLTRYHEVHNAYGRAAIRLDGKELVCFSWEQMYRQERDVCEIWAAGRWCSFDDPVLKKKWDADGVHCEGDFLRAASEFVNMPIADALVNDDFIIRIFAIMDRRVGARTLETIRAKGEYLTYPDWVKQFYLLRLENELRS